MSKTNSEQYLKAWLNYRCSQGNNWITIYKFNEIINHTKAKYFELTPSQSKQGNGSGTIASQIVEKPLVQCHLSTESLRHVYFTYMTEQVLITLIETLQGHLYLINNQLHINIDPINQSTGDGSVKGDVCVPPSNVINIDANDDIKDKLQQTQEQLTQINELMPLPQLQSVDSKIYQLSQIKDLLQCLTAKQLKKIGIKPALWLKCQFKQQEQIQLMNVSFMNMITLSDADLLPLLEQFLEQSKDTLNLTHHYAIIPSLLNQIKVNTQIKQLILYQNFQIADFQWLSQLPNLSLLNLWYNHQIELSHIEQIVKILPRLEVVNIHFCCRLNLRVVIPLLKLTSLKKLLIDDDYFWCQKSTHELFILPHEWKHVYCASLDKLAITSKNLTLDVLDYLLIACPNIKQVLVDDEILKMVDRNINGGYDKDDTMSFHSWQQPNKGFQVCKQVTFKNMFKDTYQSQPFSDSMLKKIQQHRLERQEEEPIPMIAKGEENLGFLQ